MRKIEAAMVVAVRDAINGNDKTWRSGNTRAEVEHEGIQGTAGYERSVVVFLHDNEIARFDSSLSHARSAAACESLMPAGRQPQPKAG